jgi:hypothetical protein
LEDADVGRKISSMSQQLAALGAQAEPPSYAQATAGGGDSYGDPHAASASSRGTRSPRLVSSKSEELSLAELGKDLAECTGFDGLPVASSCGNLDPFIQFCVLC